MKTLIEVGAFDGSDSLNYYNNGYRVFTFEPKRDLYQSLIDKTKNLKNYKVIQKAVCLKNGKTTFNICKSGGASSILEFRSEEELNKTWSPDRWDVHYSGESYEVETTRLDTFIEQEGLQNTIIDFIHIDAQGVDLECLMSLDKYINNINEGVVETVMLENKSIYKNQNINTFENVKKFLEQNNFHIVNIISNDRVQCEYNIHFKKNNI
jgi:FkbM family methyltransferase